MRRLILIGKRHRSKESVVIDLGAYKEARRNKKQTKQKPGTRPESGESKRSADKRKRRKLRSKYKPATRRYPWEFF